jgi:hypothetical protein
MENISDINTHVDGEEYKTCINIYQCTRTCPSPDLERNVTAAPGSSNPLFVSAAAHNVA